jgi:quercetin dioxygenase-like cupin family protein
MATATREEIRIGGLAIRFVAEAKETGGALAMFEFDVAAGARVPAAHSHDAYDETVYGLAGVLTLTVEGARSEVGPGDALFIPRGAVHRFDNLGGGGVRALAVVTPGLLGPAYFREVAEVLRAAAGGPPDLGALAAVMRRHGLTPAPPPPAA